MSNGFSLDGLRNNGEKITVTNRGNKRAGVSYDYMDKLNQYVDQGIFYDKDNDGFTKADKESLENEFFSVHTEKDYNTNFGKMRAGETFDYTGEDFIRLAKAAGYILKDSAVENKKAEPAKIADMTKEETLKSAEVEVTPIEVPVNNEVAGEYDIEGYEIYNPETGETTSYYTVTDKDGNTTKFDGDFMGSLQLEKTAEVDVESESESAPAAPQIAKEPDALVHKANSDIASEEQTQVSEPEEIAEAEPQAAAEDSVEAEEAQAVEYDEIPEVEAADDGLSTLLNSLAPDFESLSGEEKAKLINDKINELNSAVTKLRKGTYTEQKSRFLGMGKKTVTKEYSDEEKAQRNEEADALEGLIDELNGQRIWFKEYEGKYWNGVTSPFNTINEDGTLSERDNHYRKAEVKTETGDVVRAAAVDTYDEKSRIDTKYYQVKLAKTQSPVTNKTTWQVVPDFDNELTNATFIR